MRAVAGIVVGLVVCVIVAVIVGIIAVGTTVSLPRGTDASDARQVVAVFAAMGPGTQLGLALAWLLSALGGAFVAKRISGQAWTGWAIALLAAAYFALNASALAQPLWVHAAWAVAPLLGGLLGNMLAVRKGAEPEVVTVDDGDDPVLT